MTLTPSPPPPEIRDTPVDRDALIWLQRHVPGTLPVPDEADARDAYWLKHLAIRAYQMHIETLFNLMRMVETETRFTKDAHEIAVFERAHGLLMNVLDFRMGP